jgi:poly-gamma-glutamate synthesis protein (capsule biosynthesis protein)
VFGLIWLGWGGFFGVRPLWAEEIQFFGDILLARGIRVMIEHEGIDSLWRGLDGLFSRQALRLANLEGAAGLASACNPAQPICFAIDPSNLAALRPFDVIGLANNHALDLGRAGWDDTRRKLQELGLVALAGSHFSTTISTDNGLIGIIAVTDVVNAAADRQTQTMADSPEVIREIQRLKRLTGLVVVFSHWGRELDDYPTVTMKTLAEGFIAAGADLIVGHHPHVVGQVACLHGRPVVYSLGNFLFDQKFAETKKGAVLQCSHSPAGALACRLIAVQTPMNSFRPNLVSSVREDANFQTANATLAGCIPMSPPLWSGFFSRDGQRRRYRKIVAESAGKSIIQELAPESDQVRWQSPALPIAKMQPIDIDGDGFLEIMLIQNIFSSLDNRIAKRVYIYRLDRGLKALWRGSGLSRPLLDATFAGAGTNVSPDAESGDAMKIAPATRSGAEPTAPPLLIALHSTDSFLLPNPASSGVIVMSYRWNGFGFRGVTEKRYPGSASRIIVVRDKIRMVGTGGNIVAEMNISEFQDETATNPLPK